MICDQSEMTNRTADSPCCTAKHRPYGEDANATDMRERLIDEIKGIAVFARHARDLGATDNSVGVFIIHALFTTLDVNFNTARLLQLLQEASLVRQRVKATYEESARAKGIEVKQPGDPTAPTPPTDIEALPDSTQATLTADEEVIGLRALILSGIQGVAAYAHQARMLGQESNDIYADLERQLDFLASEPGDMKSLLAKALSVGTLNLRVMKLLDTGNTVNFGTPEPTRVRVTPVAGKAILISGHDMAQLAALLEATRDSDINVYTHGEMLTAHSYPELKKHSHLIGNYGGSWPNPQIDFAAFPGPILVTSGGIIEPQAAYSQRIFTMDSMAWPGVRHVDNHNYSTVIAAARALPGFSETAAKGTITIGFGGDAVLGMADKVINAVKTGAIRHFFLIGGCDGTAPGHYYYSEFVANTPRDTMVLTLGCAKHHFKKHDGGDIDGIPRLLDMGQCNDSYSAIKVAIALSEALECRLDDLPLSLVISVFEQKTTAVLLTLLALGFRDIRLGPALPDFVTPPVLEKLIEAFGLQPISTPEADMAAALQCSTHRLRLDDERLHYLHTAQQRWTRSQPRPR